VLGAPIITAVTPTTGKTSGGTTVYVLGSGFPNVPSITCLFGGSPVDATYLSTGAVVCLSPALGAGAVPVEIDFPYDKPTANGIQFTYEGLY